MSDQKDQKMNPQPATESVGWLNSVGPLNVSPVPPSDQGGHDRLADRDRLRIAYQEQLERSTEVLRERVRRSEVTGEIKFVSPEYAGQLVSRNRELIEENARIKADLARKNAYIESVLQLIDDYVEDNTTRTAAETLDAIDNVQLSTSVAGAQSGTA